MSFSLRHLRIFCSALLGLLAALGGGACAGTPLPEPPDALPRPQLAAQDSGWATPTNLPPTTVAVIVVQADKVPAGAKLTVINLDATAARVSELTVVDAGNVLSIQVPASAGDRLRVLFTSDRAHSPPLDLVAQARESAPPNILPVDPLGDTSLPCLRIAPSESLVLSGRRGRLSVSNGCEVSVELTRAALRTGAEGFSLAEPPTTQLAAGESIELTLEDARGPEPVERLDVLLLDVSAADGRMGRYAIDVFSDVE
jgi:hypothetical protein